MFVNIINNRKILTWIDIIIDNINLVFLVRLDKARSRTEECVISTVFGNMLKLKMLGCRNLVTEYYEQAEYKSDIFIF